MRERAAVKRRDREQCPHEAIRGISPARSPDGAKRRGVNGYSSGALCIPTLERGDEGADQYMLIISKHKGFPKIRDNQDLFIPSISSKRGFSLRAVSG